MFFHFVDLSAEPASGISTAVVLDLFSLQQSPTFSVSHPQTAPLHTLADAGEVAIVVRFLLPMEVIAGLVPKVSVAVGTEDPFLEGARRRFPALWALVST